jgi:hypothetical protein
MLVAGFVKHVFFASIVTSLSTRTHIMASEYDFIIVGSKSAPEKEEPPPRLGRMAHHEAHN